MELALTAVDLTPPQFRVLVLLDGDDAAASALADALAVSRPSVTGVVDGLVARGLVERLADEADRRRVRHSLTAAGRKSLAKAEAAIDTAFDQVLAPLAPADRERARDALTLWEQALNWQLAHRDPAGAAR